MRRVRRDQVSSFYPQTALSWCLRLQKHIHMGVSSLNGQSVGCNSCVCLLGSRITVAPIVLLLYPHEQKVPLKLMRLRSTSMLPSNSHCMKNWQGADIGHSQSLCPELAQQAYLAVRLPGCYKPVARLNTLKPRPVPLRLFIYSRYNQYATRL